MNRWMNELNDCMIGEWCECQLNIESIECCFYVDVSVLIC